MEQVSVIPQLVDVDAVARALGRSRWSIYRLAREGVLPSVRLGRSIAFDPGAVKDFVARGGRGLDERRHDGGAA
jgi:excisionase family DNA binding protein